MKTIKLPVANIAVTTDGKGQARSPRHLYEDWLRGEPVMRTGTKP